MSLVDGIRVVMLWYPQYQASDATGPSDQMYEASVRDAPTLTAEASTEPSALEALADRVMRVARHTRERELDAHGQALAAADAMTREELITWLTERAEETVLADDRYAAP